MQNKICFSVLAIALGVVCSGQGQSSKEILFYDSFEGTQLSEAWNLDTRPFDYKKYPEVEATVQTLVLDNTVSLDLVAQGDYWGGAAYLSQAGFSANPRQPLTYTIERDFLGILGVGGRCSILVYEGSGTHWINFSDSDEEGSHHGWGYNRFIETKGDNPSGASILFPALQSEDLLNYGAHTVKFVVNGVSVAFYVDDIFGGEVDFPVTEDIHFGFGVYGYTVEDMVYAGFKNVVVSQETLEPGLPIIVKQPADVIAMEQKRAMLAVESLDGKTFQWFKAGEPIEGATEETLTFDPVAMGNAGEYTVEISNDLGSVTSRTATLTVTPYVPGEVELTYEIKDGKMILTFTGSLQESDDCVNWSEALPHTSPYTVDLTAKKKFYRATL